MPNVTPGSVAAFADAVTSHPRPPGEPPPAPGVLARVRAILRRDPAGLAAASFLALLVLAALLAPWITPYDPNQQFDLLAQRRQPPSGQHWFGTDSFARDVLSRVLFGARVSLGISFVAVLLASLLGTAWGAAAGWAGGILDAVMMRVVDALLAIPRILLLLGVVALWGTLSVPALVLLLGLTGWFGVSRLVRAEVLAARQRDFVTAAHSLGAAPVRVLVRHVVPQAAAPLLVAAALGVGHVIVVEAGLAFLGFGVPAPQASWGNLIRDGFDAFTGAWWLTVVPGVALASTVLALNVLVDRLRLALNPRQLHGP
ncbi:MAG TPA: ABC transporter permease [Gemmatimonadaceae bacterium]|nr:ABC transporter permease [Gemmatimonadaceae bacterium]